MLTPRQKDVFWTVWKNEPIGISSIAEQIKNKVSIPTLNRDLAQLKKENFLSIEGSGPGTKYRVRKDKLINTELDVEDYFKADPDERKIITHYNQLIFEQLPNVQIFSAQDTKDFELLSYEFQEKVKKASPAIYRREFERLMIELAWKSSQIEGNTYDLLDTEQLLKYNIPSSGHSDEESIMLLNHKAAIEYVRSYAEDYREITPGKIINIHSLLIQKLNIVKDFRKRLVRITGTAYTPPNNPFVIQEAVEKLCRIVNKTKNVLEKAFLSVLLLSYVQPFEDGNKRTARLLANAILMSDNRCPLSYRSISPSEYKKAILLFYELNNITAFRKIFLSQYRFAVKNYF